MVKILSIETGTDVCSVGLSVNGELISIRETGEGKNHAQNIAVFIEDIFHESLINADEIDAVAVSSGPGSYTGLRIGVSLAKGFCYANDIPLISVNSLKSLVVCAIEDEKMGVVDFNIDSNTVLLPMIDARRMEVYTQAYDTDVNEMSKVEAKIIDETSFNELQDKNIVIFGSGAEKCFEIINVPNKTIINVSPSARGLTKIAAQKFENKEFEDLAYFEPLYLKDFIGTKSKKNYLK